MSEDIKEPQEGEQLTLEQINRILKRNQANSAEPQGPTRADLDNALDTLPDGQDDPDYVVRAMRSHFGDLFTDDDEDVVRDRVKARETKPSDGLKVDEIKAALAEKGISIPEGVTLKADLAALLDESAE